MKANHIDGDNKGQIMLYALSTCVWCKKTKELLQKLHIGFNYVDVDQLSEDDRQRALEEIRKWNPSCSFPSMVIDNNQCIVGYKEQQIRDRFAS